ncbi:7796_t:CDS:1 [Funneliformis geosporum]|uniref:7796_t:CDS:1 n=1 Tax=Funneliformis geosporum TaxID=1117311 RepID=A0A9W4WTJ0_9GLOM|nr:7796_t:CDS:1 [Funneliformis geosporum]
MVSARLEAQKQTIRHYWLNAIKLAKEIQKKTSIPLYSIERNLKKLRETGDVNHQCNNGRKSKVTQDISQAIGQHVHKNTAVSTC